MGFYKYVRNLWKKPKSSMPEIMKTRLIKWRKQPSTVRIDKPTRIDRARSLGYKAKQGVMVVRQRVSRSKHMRPKFKSGRRSKHRRRRMALDMSYQGIAEQRANKKFPNMEVLNSYWVAEDPKHMWFEIILLNPVHNAIKNDKNLGRVAKQKGRVYRGRTSSHRKSRGLRVKGKNSRFNK